VAGDWTGWIRFFLESVAASADEAPTLIESLDALRARWHEQLQSARSSALLIKLADSLFERPATTHRRSGQPPRRDVGIRLG